MKKLGLEKILLSVLIILTCLELSAQEERRLIRQGNRFFKEGKFSEAETNYKKAGEIAPDIYQLESNLGAARYRQGMFESALGNYTNLLDLSKSNEEKADVLYNIGNTLLQAAEYDKSMEAYRNALRLNPEHDKSRYNMAVAQKMKEQQQQNQQNQDQDQDDDQEQDEDQEQQPQDNEDEQEQEQEQEQQQDQSEMSPEEMERFLEALEDRDREIQEELQKERHKTERRQVEKNW